MQRKREIKKDTLRHPMIVAAVRTVLSIKSVSFSLIVLLLLPSFLFLSHLTQSNSSKDSRGEIMTADECEREDEDLVSQFVRIWPSSVIEYVQQIQPHWQKILRTRASGEIAAGWRYGNYGGPGHHDWDSPPVDALDLCFLCHDCEMLQTHDGYVTEKNLDPPLAEAIEFLRKNGMIEEGTGADRFSRLIFSPLFRIGSDVWRLMYNSFNSLHQTWKISGSQMEHVCRSLANWSILSTVSHEIDE